MSDSQKFGGAPSVEVADHEPIPESTEEPGGRFNPKLLAVAGGVILVLAAAAYFLLFSGGGTDTSQTGTVPTAPRTSTAPSKPAASAAPTKVPAVVGSGLSSNGRDPFEPLVTAATPTPSATPTSTTGTGTGGTTTPTGINSSLTVNSVNFAGNSANVTVDGKPYIAYAGVLFAKYYTLKVVVQGSAGCAVFDFGDLPAQLCKGQTAKFTG